MDFRNIIEKLTSSRISLGALYFAVIIPQIANIVDINDPDYLLSQFSWMEIFLRGVALAFFIDTPIILLAIFIMKKFKSVINSLGFWVFSGVSFVVVLGLLKPDGSMLLDFIMMPIWLSVFYGIAYVFSRAVKTTKD